MHRTPVLMPKCTLCMWYYTFKSRTELGFDTILSRLARYYTQTPTCRHKYLVRRREAVLAETDGAHEYITRVHVQFSVLLLEIDIPTYTLELLRRMYMYAWDVLLVTAQHRATTVPIE